MAKKRFYASEDYAGVDSRRRMENRDFNMISEDHSSFANLPQQVIYKEYPKTEYFSYDLNDNINGIDNQMNDDVRGSKKKSGKYPEKY